VRLIIYILLSLYSSLSSAILISLPLFLIYSFYFFFPSSFFGPLFYLYIFSHPSFSLISFIFPFPVFLSLSCGILNLYLDTQLAETEVQVPSAARFELHYGPGNTCSWREVKQPLVYRSIQDSRLALAMTNTRKMQNVASLTHKADRTE
jgi:hypothetical protein